VHVNDSGVDQRDDWTANADPDELASLFPFLTPGDVIEVRLEGNVEEARNPVELAAASLGLGLTWVNTDDPTVFQVKVIQQSPLASESQALNMRRPRSGNPRPAEKSSRKGSGKRKTKGKRKGGSKYGDLLGKLDIDGLAPRGPKQPGLAISAGSVHAFSGGLPSLGKRR
jgi:hypothetical protein